jgi:hypothetical protein
MAMVDLNLEWLGYVQPVGLVISPTILDRYGLVPEEQTRADGESVAVCFTPEGETRALDDPWTCPLRRRPHWCQPTCPDASARYREPQRRMLATNVKHRLKRQMAFWKAKGFCFAYK